MTAVRILFGYSVGNAFLQTNQNNGQGRINEGRNEGRKEGRKEEREGGRKEARPIGRFYEGLVGWWSGTDSS